MADQLAVAIDNANLFAQSQEALQLERRAYSDTSSKRLVSVVRFPDRQQGLQLPRHACRSHSPRHGLVSRNGAGILAGDDSVG